MAVEKDDIERYRDGTLGSAERHALEKKALSDPFLQDALDGVESISAEELSTDLNDLHKKIQRPQSVTWFTPLRIAASVMMMVGLGYLFYFLSSEEPVTMALEKSAGVSVDTLIASSKDSSNLLSLADETKTQEEKSKLSSSKPIEKDQVIAKQDVVASSSPLDSEPIIAFREEEQTKVSERMAERIDDNSEVTVQAAPAPASSGASAELKKESVNRSKVGDRKGLASADQPAKNSIVGKVTSSDDGLPIAGVNVVVEGTNEGAVTDANGNYQINTQVKNPKLIYSFIGMQSAVLKPSGNQQDVQLKEDVSQLSDVVVTGQKADPYALYEPVVKMASPEGGIRAYNQYLENNLRYPEQALESNVKGKVTISFTVGTDGRLDDFVVVKGLGHGCDDEVIRLVKDGPAWSPTTQDDVAVESQVKVKLKFDPAKTKK